MGGTARIEMRPRRRAGSRVCGHGRLPACAAAARRHHRDARHLNLIPGCVWSLASPAAYTAAACSVHVSRACLRARPPRSPFTHAPPQTRRVTGSRHFRRGLRAVVRARRGEGDVSDLSIGDILCGRDMCMYVRVLHVARGSRFCDAR